MDYEKELRGVLTELLEEKQKPVTNGLKVVETQVGAVKTGLESFQGQFAEIDERLKAVEARGERKIVVPTGVLADPEWREKFAKWMLKSIDLSRKNPLTKAALQEDTATEGAELIPTELWPGVLRIARGASIALANCQIIPMTSKTKVVPTLTTNPSMSWADEEAIPSESEPVFGSKTLTAKKVGAYAKISKELVADADIDVIAFVGTLFGEALGQELDKQVFSGTGSPCSGILQALTGINSVVMGTGSTAFSSIHTDKLSEMISQIDDNAIEGAMFCLHRTVLHYVRILKDTNNNPIFAPPGATVPGRIFDFPYKTSAQMPSTSAVSTGFVWFGDLKYFLIGDRKMLELDANPNVYWTTDQIGLKLTARFALSVGLPAAFSRLVTAAS